MEEEAGMTDMDMNIKPEREGVGKGGLGEKRRGWCLFPAVGGKGSYYLPTHSEGGGWEDL